MEPLRARFIPSKAGLARRRGSLVIKTERPSDLRDFLVSSEVGYKKRTDQRSPGEAGARGDADVISSERGSRIFFHNFRFDRIIFY